MSATQPIRNKEQVRTLADYYLDRGELRNHLLIVMSVHTALRVSDLLRLKWDDVYNFDTNRVRTHVAIKEMKTGKRKLIALNNKIVKALLLCVGVAKRDEWLMKSRKGGAISRVQAYRIIRAAAEALNFGYSVSCHSLRKTFGYLSWKSGTSPAVIMEIYNHSDFVVTRRYLGVAQDDKDTAYHDVAMVV